MNTLLKVWLVANVRLLALAVLSATSLMGVAIELLAANGPAGPFGLLRYYTIQSNILVAVVAATEIALLVRNGKAGPAFGRVRMAVVIAIMVTGILFSLFLADRWHPVGILVLSNFLLHYWNPVAAFLIWILFAEKGFIRFRHAPEWIAFPLVYVIYTLLQGWLTGFYPYWFVNPNAPPPDGIGSWAGLAAFVAIVCAGFLAVGGLLVFVDRAIAEKKPRS